MVETLIQIIIIALLVSYSVQGLKKAIKINNGFSYVNNKVNLKVVLSIVLSALLCVSGGIDIFKCLGVNIDIPILPELLTSLIVCQGASVIHDIQKQITELKERK